VFVNNSAEVTKVTSNNGTWFSKWMHISRSVLSHWLARLRKLRTTQEMSMCSSWLCTSEHPNCWNMQSHMACWRFRTNVQCHKVFILLQVLRSCLLLFTESGHQHAAWRWPDRDRRKRSELVWRSETARCPGKSSVCQEVGAWRMVTGAHTVVACVMLALLCWRKYTCCILLHILLTLTLSWCAVFSTEHNRICCYYYLPLQLVFIHCLFKA
jgi:hypothetical protein